MIGKILDDEGIIKVVNATQQLLKTLLYIDPSNKTLLFCNNYQISNNCVELAKRILSKSTKKYSRELIKIWNESTRNSVCQEVFDFFGMNDLSDEQISKAITPIHQFATVIFEELFKRSEEEEDMYHMYMVMDCQFRLLEDVSTNKQRVNEFWITSKDVDSTTKLMHIKDSFDNHFGKEIEAIRISKSNANSELTSWKNEFADKLFYLRVFSYFGIPDNDDIVVKNTIRNIERFINYFYVPYMGE